MNKKLILILVAIGLLIIGIIGYFFPATLIQVTQAHTDINHSVSSADLAVAQELFQKNNIEMGTLAIYRVYKDEHGTMHVSASQFYKGLPVFFGEIGYHFDQSGRAHSNIDGEAGIYTSGDRIGDLGISTEPSISISAAAKRAREKMKLNYFFTAELGVLDLNAGASYATPNFVLAWRMKPKDAETYPYAIIDANTGKLLRYDDGIRY